MTAGISSILQVGGTPTAPARAPSEYRDSYIPFQLPCRCCQPLTVNDSSQPSCVSICTVFPIRICGDTPMFLTVDIQLHIYNIVNAILYYRAKSCVSRSKKPPMTSKAMGGAMGDLFCPESVYEDDPERIMLRRHAFCVQLRSPQYRTPGRKPSDRPERPRRF